MASTSTLRSVGGFVAAAATALVVFAIVSDPFGGTPTASIALTVSAAESQDTLLVTAEYRGFASLDVAPAVDDVRTPVRDVLAYDSSGAEVPVQVLSGAAQSGFEGASVPRRSYRLASGAAPGNVYEVRYAVSSATGRFGGNCRSPLRFSTISGGATVVPLSSMLLVPSRPFDRLSVAVPDDSALVLLPDGSKSFAADGDLSGIWGPVIVDTAGLTESSIAIGTSRIRVLYGSEDHPGAAEDAEWALELCALLSELLGYAPDLQIVLRPESGEYETRIESSDVELVIASLDRSSRESKEHLARALASRFLGFRFRSLEVSPDVDAWLPIGLANLLGRKALLAKGERWASIEQLAGEFVREYDENLADIPTGETSDYFARRKHKSTLLAQLLEWELAGTGGDEAGVAALRRIADIARSGAPYSQLEAFSRRWVYEYNRVRLAFPFPQFSSVLKPTQSPRAGDRPFLSLVVTGDSRGFLESCGCKRNQGGGVARRATAVARLRGGASEPLLVDLGGFMPQSEVADLSDSVSAAERAFFLQTMASLCYDAVTPAPEELEGNLSSEFLVFARDNDCFPLTAFSLPPDVASPCRVVDVGGHRIGLFGVTGTEEPSSFADFAAALERLTAELELDGTVLLGDVSYQLLDFLESAGTAPAVALQRGSTPLWVADATGNRSSWTGWRGSTLVARVGADLKNVGRLDLMRGPDGVVTADLSRIQLSESVPEEPLTRAAMDEFVASLAADSEASGGSPRLFRSDPMSAGRHFVGAQECADCHTSQMAQWKSTAHADAYNTLVREHRERHPKCVVCHVTGMGESGGFELNGSTMRNVQCEVCHGAGAEHASDPRAANIRRTPHSGVCLECHNDKHSDYFEARLTSAMQSVSH